VTSAQDRAARLAALPFQPAAPVGGRLTGFLAALRDILRNRELLDLLVRRELKARYKDSSLGFLWSFLRPLTMLLIYFVAIGQFLGAARSIPDFGIFVFTGLTLWGLYNEIVTGGTQSILGNAGLIKKVYLPREIFPLAATGSALFNFVIQFIVLIAATVIFGQFAWTWRLLYVPAAIAIVLVYGVALALLLSAWNVYLRDVQYLVEVALMIFFWASPIVYSWSFVEDAAARSDIPWLTDVYLLNPMSTAILAFQKGIWTAGSEARSMGVDASGAEVIVGPQPWPADLDLRIAIVFVVGLVLLWVCQRIFARLQGNFAQEI
jgi:ABC-2 type transport system permease protein